MQNVTLERRNLSHFMKMKGLPINLDTYEPPEVRTNRHFREFEMPDFEKVYLPESMRPLMRLDPLETRGFVMDDNRGAVSPTPSVSIDGTDFFLSVKGIGSTTNPFSRQLLRKSEICSLLKDPRLRERILGGRETEPRYITSELWQRFSPYGGQGIEHALYSLRASEMDDITSIHGFRIAPVVKVVFLPQDLEAEIRKLYWYRRFEGRIVQETRLVPSNVRVYFHSGVTVGGTITAVFDLFEIDSNDKALDFLKNFVKSGVAFLTLFARSMKSNGDGSFSGLDFLDVWLDKDAVIAPDGTVYFVDLEGLEWIAVGEKGVKEKIYGQVYRSLYEFMYAYEQIERERFTRFGGMTDRKVQFEHLLRDALKEDEVLDLRREGDSLVLTVDNILGEHSLAGEFSILDW